MLTRRMMVQALADRMAGLGVSPRLVRQSKHFAEPWKTIWMAIESAERAGEEIQETIVKALECDAEREKILAEILYAKPGNAYGEYPSLAEQGDELPPVHWLWKGWIPTGMVTLMGASPGVGKSYLCLDLARRIIHRENFPDGQPVDTLGEIPRVIYVDAEAVPQILNQRAMGWNMNRSRLFLMCPDLDDILDFSQAKYRDRLTQMIAQLEPGLVIVDSLSSISSKGENNIEDVRQIMSFLNMLAREYETAMMIIHHLRKHNSTQMQLIDLSLDDFRGSSHIGAMARSVIGVSIVQTTAAGDRNGPRKVEIIKTNLGPYPEALGFQFMPGVEGGVVLRWNAKAPEAYQEPTKKDDIREWLEDFLKVVMEGRPVSPKDVIKAAKQEDISRAMVYRVRDELKKHIKNTEGRKSRGNCWQWSNEELPDEKDYEEE